MKHLKSTISVVSTRDGESQQLSSLEWSPKCDFHLEPKKFIKADGSRPELLSSETRRVSTFSSSSNSRSSVSSCSSLSDLSLSLGFRSYDEIDDGTTSASAVEVDPIISLEGLSLDTRRHAFGATTSQTPLRTKSIEKPKSVIVEEEPKQYFKVGKVGKRSMIAMRRSVEKEQKPSTDSLCLASLSVKDRLDRTIRPVLHLNPSGENQLDGQIQEGKYKTTETNLDVSFFDVSSSRQASLPKPKNECHKQRRTMGKKYTVKMRTNATSRSCITETESPRSLRMKRQRGGSDFMGRSLGIDDLTSNVDVIATSSSFSRKRRRINRNRAMAADDFDSILSQIHAGSV